MTACGDSWGTLYLLESYSVLVVVCCLLSLAFCLTALFLFWLDAKLFAPWEKWSWKLNSHVLIRKGCWWQHMLLKMCSLYHSANGQSSVIHARQGSSAQCATLWQHLNCVKDRLLHPVCVKKRHCWSLLPRLWDYNAETEHATGQYYQQHFF